MAKDGVSGCVGGGCGGLSFIGLLVGVGLTAWLGSIAMNGGFGSDHGKGADDRASVASVASILATTTTSPTPTAPLTVDPTTGLDDGGTLTVRSSAFPAGASVRITTCLARATLATGDADLCDATTAATVTADPAGGLEAPYVVHRVVTVGGTPFDCAQEAASCAITATAVDRPALRGSTPITFAPQAHGPEITLPD